MVSRAAISGTICGRRREGLLSAACARAYSLAQTSYDACMKQRTASVAKLSLCESAGTKAAVIANGSESAPIITEVTRLKIREERLECYIRLSVHKSGGFLRTLSRTGAVSQSHPVRPDCKICSDLSVYRAIIIARGRLPHAQPPASPFAAPGAEAPLSPRYTAARRSFTRQRPMRRVACRSVRMRARPRRRLCVESLGARRWRYTHERMSGDISINLGSTFEYVEAKVREALGYDEASKELRLVIDTHLRRAIHDASTVQVIGMDRPVSIFEIYQPTLLLYPRSSKTTSPSALIKTQSNAIVFAGPGRGKTTLLHYILAHLGTKSSIMPLLFTLRWEGATRDLSQLIEHLARRSKSPKGGKLLLLLDGLDEISPQLRKNVASDLRAFAAMGLGWYIASCRSFYDADDLKAQHLEIAPFSRTDSYSFITAFARCYGTVIDGEKLLKELDEHGFADYVSHPLMLAMICILKSGPMPDLPHSPLRLTQRAINTLTARWDDSKGVSRSSRLQLDGEDRSRCLMHIAFGMPYLAASVTTVEQLVADFLRLLQRTDIPAPALLLEMAQWYGILVPSTEHQWTFVHRTIHDYLAAKFWVESGRFQPQDVVMWDSRAAYAACLTPNATASILAALKKSFELGPVVECFYNRPLFDAEAVANGLEQFFNRNADTFSISAKNGIINVATTNDFFAVASTRLLEELARLSLEGRTSVRDFLLAYSLSELRRRSSPLPGSLASRLHAVFRGTSQFRVARGPITERFAVTDFL